MTTYLKLAYSLLFVFITFSYTVFSTNITPSLTHDELIYAANAYSLSRQGTDVTATYNLFEFKPIHPMYAEFPASLMAPFFKVVDNPILATHALPTLFSIFLPFIFSWISFSLFKNHRLSFMTALVVAVSPLNWQFSKLTYDAFFSLFFFFLGGAVYLHYQNKRSLLSIPIFIIGFFNYQGYKLILLPWAIILFLLKQKSSPQKSPDRIALIPPLVVLLLMFIFAVIILPQQSSVNRLSQTIFTDINQINEVAHQKSLLSLAPQLGRFFNHKWLIITQSSIDRLLGSLNPHMLFLFGEPSSSGFAVWSHGFFYIFDSILILLGFYLLLAKNTSKKTGLLWLFAVIVGLTPAIISTLSEWYLMRSLFSYYLFLIPISYALYWLSKSKKVFPLVALLYLVSIANFAYQYYFRYPLYRSNQAELHERIVVEYANRAQVANRVIVYDDEPHYLYLNHALLKQMSLPKPITSYQESIYTFDNIIYTNQCQEEESGDIVISSDLYDPCQSHLSPAQAGVVSVIDSGIKYRIHNDQLCSSVTRNNYIRIATLKELSFDNLSDLDFCNRWITAYQSN